MKAPVWALAVSGSDVYAGGDFTTAGGSSANYIAQWNGSSWSALGSGMNFSVLALAVSGSDLYAGGHFTTAGGSAANYIAKWNGSTWTALGSGMGASVMALATSGSDLYAGGAFTRAGGSAANSIAKWNGSNWSALGSGTGGTYPPVLALAVSSSDLYAGGYFTTAGGKVSAYVARAYLRTLPALSLLVPNDTVFSRQFGHAVAIDGDTAVIGAPLDSAANINAGAAYVFVRAGATWVEQAKLTAGDAGFRAEFGNAVAISGETIVVGAHADPRGDGVPEGAAYVFARNGTGWSQQAKLMSADPAAGQHQFGSAVAIDGEVVAVGAIGDKQGGSDAGAVYVFRRREGTWMQEAKLLSDDPRPSNALGFSLGLAGDTLVAGSPYDDDIGSIDSGAIYVFVRSGTTWMKEAELRAGDAASNAHLGWSVALRGDTVVGGAPENKGSGAAYVFVRNTGVWRQQAKLVSDDLAAAGDQFGYAVGLDGNSMVVGAILASFFAVNGSPVEFGGSAYVFYRDGTTWTQEVKGSPGDLESFDEFGFSVAISGSTFIAGAPFKGALDNGAGYLFVWAPNTPPIAKSQSVTTAEDTSVVITLAASDADGDALTYTVLSTPVRGSLIGTGPNLIYTPNPNENGSDGFTFQVNDGSLNSAVATVSITITPVNNAPVANSQSVATGENVPVMVTLSGSDIEGDALRFTVLSGPTKGSLSGAAPNLTYTPNPNESGTDSFTFQVNDGSLNSAVATVSITTFSHQLWTWSIRKGGNDLHGVGFGNGTFVAVGDAGTILTSSDGRNWRNQIYSNGGNLRSVAFGNGRFVAVGDGTLTSSDGTNWSRGGVSGPFNGIGHGNGLFVVVGDQGRILSSADGVTWTNQNSSVTNSLKGVAWGNGKFIVAGDGLVLSSTDAIAWNSQTQTNLILESVTYGNGTFVIGGTDPHPEPILGRCCNGVLLSSDDGLTWTNRFSSSTINYSPSHFAAVAYGDGNFVAVGWAQNNTGAPLPDGGDHILTSTNGVNWTVVDPGFADGPFNAAVGLFGLGYGNNTFVAVGPVGLIGLSTNGSSWEAISPDSYDHLYGVASGGQTILAVGARGAIYSSVGGDSWVRQSSPVTNDLTSVAYGNGVFVAAGSGTIIVSSNGGTSWQSVTLPGASKVIFHNGLFLVVLGFQAFTSSDGLNWRGAVFADFVFSHSAPRDFTGGNGLFVIVGNTSYTDALGRPEYSYSTGAIWTSAGQGSWAGYSFSKGELFSACAFGNGRFLVTGSANLTSTDGVTWSAWNPPWPPWAVNRILFGHGTFLAMTGGRSQNGRSGDFHLITSTNGLDWTTGPLLTSNAMLGGCYEHGQGTFVLVGAFGTIVQSAGFGSHPPVAGADTVERFAAQDVKVKVATLLANDTDVDGDELSITGVSSTSAGGATLILDDGWVHYTSPPGFTSADSFTYTVSDGYAGTATGTVAVKVKADSGATQNIAGIQHLGNGTFRITFNGIPGRTYRIQYTEALNPPNTVWTPLGLATADGVGVFIFNDTAGSAARFYRSTYP